MNLEGRILANRYEIIEKIGNGGMATVYKARCNVLNRYVAVKILRDEFTTDQEFVRRFNTEAQSAASITHPNIVSVYDVGKEGDLYYIVMELIKGKTLKEIIIEDGALPWKWSLNIAIQIASALETAHRNNIIHRDIKPHNIIITEDGIAKVTDFGIAKAVSNSTITAFGTTIGSVHYFSPEHARGGLTDAKSDLYSLGVVMYEMLTGRVPFDADTPVSVALKHMQEEPMEPIKLNPNIPMAINKIIIKAMQKDVNLRYNSASEMLQDLSMALKKPEDNFVVIEKSDENLHTQRVVIGEELAKEGRKNNVADNGKKQKKKNKLKEFITKHKVLSFFLGAAILFFLTIAITMLVLNLTSVKEVPLPNLVGLSKEEAQENLKDLKLEFEIIEEVYDEEVPAGFIISQDPPYQENYNVKEKTKISVVVSLGTEVVKVPKVTGLKQEEAIESLKERNLVEEIVEETSTKVEAGYVIRQDPEANKEVNSGSTVKIYVSIGTGIKQVVVNSVVGRQEVDAKTTLTNLGLKVEIAYEEDTTKENGIVLKQSIDAGKTVDENTTIVITVNRIAQTISGRLIINVKSITGGYDETDESISDSDKITTVTVKVDGKQVFNQDRVDKNNSAFPVNISGKGEVYIEVSVGSNLRTYTMNLKSETEHTFR